jgi:hypothetical protein
MVQAPVSWKVLAHKSEDQTDTLEVDLGIHLDFPVLHRFSK